jgi:FdhE protein
MPYAERAATMKRSEWEKRVDRAARLAERFAYAQEILALYAEVLKFQQRIFADISSRTPPGDEDTPLLERLRSMKVLDRLPALLSLAEECGTEKLAEQASAIRCESAQQRAAMLEGFLSGEMDERSFFARALLQPYAEWLASNAAAASPQGDSFVCPLCNSRPQAAVLRPEGDGGKRFLLCSLCLREWEFRRILCPVCHEENHRQLPRYTAEDVNAVRVEACDTCHFYLKSIDLTVDGLAVPLVDEVAAVPLDLWASEHGYKKVTPNLMGF